MEFSLVDNGADSLKKVKQCIDSFQESHEEFSYHYLKDATIFLSHTIEILLKHILTSRNESLVFKNLKAYTEAKKELSKKYKDQVKVENGFGHYPSSQYTVFDVPKGEFLETIGITEAIERVKYFCDIEMSKEFVASIHYIKNYRNKIMHHSIRIYPHEMSRYIKKLIFLYEETLNFFELHIPGLMAKVDFHRYEIDKAEWEELQSEMQSYYTERAMSKVL